MSSKIEKAIDEIEEYIDSCKFRTFSNTEIVVNKEELDGLLKDLRKKAPKEIEEYQKVVANREEILQAARNKAKNIIDEAAIKTSELVSEHEIMQEAYLRANEIVDVASSKAQEIIDSATMEANDIKDSAMAYTDNLLGQLEDLIGHYMNQSNDRYNALYSSLGECLDIVQSNRAELAPADEPIDNLLADDSEDDGFEKLDL